MVKSLKNFLRRIYYLKSFSLFKACGKNIILSKGGTIIRPNEIVLGSNVFINRNFHISARNLNIGTNIMIGPNLVIECDNHQYNNIGSSMFDEKNVRNTKGVTLEDDIWLGANVTILSGAYISEGCVIGACSLVNKYIPPYTVSYGIPCKVIKTRFSEKELRMHLASIGKLNHLEGIISKWEQYNLI